MPITLKNTARNHVLTIVMSEPSTSSGRHDASPEATLSVIARHDGTLLIDLDETLYLQNSTEDFIDCARPGLVALLILRLIDVVKPWRWTGGEQTRDVWRVRLISLLFPWIWLRWREQVSSLAEHHTNRPLAQALRASNQPLVIVTAGFTPIVTPLLAALGFADCRCIAMRHTTFSDRRAGKLLLTEQALGTEIIANALLVTDSKDDLPLLDRCRQGARTIWPDARYRRALSRVYLPGQYLTLIKRPGERYIVRGIIQEDFAFWVIASLGLASFWPTHLLGLTLLLISFWAIYERGYVDNDWVAQHHEKNPKLSKAYGVVEVATPRFTPWVWAASCGTAAILLLRWPAPPKPQDFAIWAALLIATHWIFRAYNRLDKNTRVWIFPALQFARTGAFALLVPVGLTATLGLAAHLIARWIPYYGYRLNSKNWPDGQFFLSRLLIYLLLNLIFALTQRLAMLLTWTALAMLSWNVVRARKDLRSLISEARRIDRSAAP